MWSVHRIESVTQDVRFGARLLRRSPLFALAAVMSLAIGIGAAAAVFSLTNTVLRRRLPVPDPDALVVLRWEARGPAPFRSLSGRATRTDRESSSTSFPLAAFEAVRAEASDLLDTFAFADAGRANVLAGGVPVAADAQVVSGNYFGALGVPAAAGRTIVESDLAPSAPPVAVISYDFWRQRFGAAPSAVGAPMVVNGATFTIVGVTPRGFAGTLQVGERPDVTVPLTAYQTLARGGDPRDPGLWWLLMMGRLRPGVSSDDAAPRVEAIVRQSTVAASRTQGTAGPLRVSLQPGAGGQRDDSDRMREPLEALTFVVAIVLVVGCANVSTLLLGRGRARARELAVRSAIGASRSRVVRQLLTESVLLAVLGGALGWLLAARLVAALAPALAVNASPGSELTVGLDGSVLAFTLVIASACSLLVGLVPALRATAQWPVIGLEEAARGAVGHGSRFGAGLVVAQFALSLVLLSAAGLLAFSLRNLQMAAPGFDPENVLVFDFHPQQNGYDQPRIRRTLDAALTRLRALPGVTSASMSSQRLMSNASPLGLAARLDEPLPRPGGSDPAAFGQFVRSHRAWPIVVDDAFFATMRIAILRGRAFSSHDSEDAPMAAVVNERLAHQLFGTSDVVGRQFRSGLTGELTLTIVGVAADARYSSMRAAPPPALHLSTRQRATTAVTFAVRTSGPSLPYVTSVHAALREVDPSVPPTDFRTQREQMAVAVVQERRLAQLATGLGVTAALLVAVGLYGLLAGAVEERTQEIGVRMALGATPQAVHRAVLGRSMMFAGAGLALGFPAAVWGMTLLDSMLYGLTSRDPWTVAGASLVLAGVAVAAALVPARRASRIDPLVAMRAH